MSPLPYDSSDATIDECQRQAAQLRASGKYRRVFIRCKKPERGVEFGRVFVEHYQSSVSIGRYTDIPGTKA